MRDESAREGTWAIATGPDRPSCIAVWPRPVDSLDVACWQTVLQLPSEAGIAQGRARPGRKATVLIAQDDDDPVRRSRPPGGARHRVPAGRRRGGIGGRERYPGRAVHGRTRRAGTSESLVARSALARAPHHARPTTRLPSAAGTRSFPPAAGQWARSSPASPSAAAGWPT